MIDETLGKGHTEVESSQHNEEPSPHIFLSPVCRFEPATDVTSVFWDNSQKLVTVVRNDEEMEVVGADGRKSRHFRINREGPLRDVKVSPEGSVIAVLRSPKRLELMRLTSIEFRLSCFQEIEYDERSSDAILGFEWTYPGELLVITGTGCYAYKFSSSHRKFLRGNKSKSMRVNWYSYWAEYGLLLASIGATTINLYQVKADGCLESLGLLNVGLDASAAATAMVQSLTRNQVFLIEAYGNLYCAAVQPDIQRECILLHHLGKSRTIALQLPRPGSYAIAVADNLIITIDASSDATVIFDIAQADDEPISPLSPSKRLTGANELLTSSHTDSPANPIWIPCLPSQILALGRGALYDVSLNMEAIIKDMRACQDDVRVCDFLLCRKDGETSALIMELLRDLLTSSADVITLRTIFRKLCSVDHNQVMERPWPLPDTSSEAILAQVNMDGARGMQHSQSGASLASLASRKSERTQGSYRSSGASSDRRRDAGFARRAHPLFEQEQIYTDVFIVVADHRSCSPPYLAACLLEYITTVLAIEPVQPYMTELLADLLVRGKCFAVLHQYVLCNIVEDTLPVARILASAKEEYSPFSQIALDMLKRLHANEEVIEMLLAQGMILDAVRFAISRDCLRASMVPTLLEAALTSLDKTLYLNVFKCLEEVGFIGFELDQHPVHPTTNRYVSVYREMWGEIVDLEIVEL
ncbi:hypothetical protein HDU85_005467 [Gaertneriomyces sp. JEL0708]|nr:hypothetical protein HDU85_005467 [Gaertneriomyces sp. JEL0708]